MTSPRATTKTVTALTAEAWWALQRDFKFVTGVAAFFDVLRATANVAVLAFDLTGTIAEGILDVRALAVGIVLGFAAIGSGCAVTLYQPMGALQRPTAVHLDDPTFANTRILVRCLASEDLPAGDADKVCRQIAQSLRQQGAETETIVPRQLDEGLPADAFDGRGAELTVEIASRTEHSHDWPLLAGVSVLTLTAIPTVEEYTFVQDITVRARNHTVLTAETLRARLVTYTGCVVWSLHSLLDLTVRNQDDDVVETTGGIIGSAAQRSYSRDFYRQIAQLTHNARVRSDVLGLTTPQRRQAQRPTPTTTAPMTTPPGTAPPPPPPSTAPPPPPPPPATPSSSPSDLSEPPPLLSPPQAF